VTLLASAAAFTATPAVRAPATKAMTINMKKNIANKDVWVTFAEAKDIKRGEIISGFQYGQEIALACTKNGAIYALSNKLPPTSQPSTLGNIFGDDIVEPLCGTAFSLKTGKVNGNWCPSFLGKLIFGRLVPPTNVPVFKTRTQGGKVQVLININAKAQFEANYWRGVLDSQGKVDGGYY